MQTPIDFGKKFIYSYFRNRSADATIACLSDDIIWVTPEEIYHLNTKVDIRAFVEKRISQDPQQYTVDIASIRSAPGSGDTGTIVYEVNLIPRKEEEAINLRCSLTIHKAGVGYKIIFIGMSRRYERSDREQMRGFMEDLPSGILVLASLGGSDVRALFSNGYLRGILGYEEGEFYEKTDVNPFFMVPLQDQKRLFTLVAELSNLSRPKPLAMQVSLCRKEGEELPFQAILKAAYKDGRRTILYLMFHDISDILLQEQRKYRRDLAAMEETYRKEVDGKVAEQTQQTLEKQQELEEELERVRKEAQNLVREADAKAQDMVAAAQSESLEVKQDLEQLRAESEEKIQALLEEKEEAIRQAREEADRRIEQTQAESSEKLTALELKSQEQLQTAQEEADRKFREAEENSRLRMEEADREHEEQLAEARGSVAAELEETKAALVKAQEELESIRHKYEESQDRKAESDRQYESRILKLTWDLQHSENEAKTKIEEETQRLQKEAEEKIASAQLDAEKASETAAREIEDIRAQAEGAKQGYLTQISRLTDTIREQELGLDKQKKDTAILIKEKDKTIARMQHLIGGQMRSIFSTLSAAREEKDLVREGELISEAVMIAQDAPAMAEDLSAIGLLDLSVRGNTKTDFELSECINTVRGVIWPQCREKGIIFSCETDGTVPDSVTGDKSALQLAFLGILENAMQGTARGGKIILTVTADPPIRGKAYFHFVIKDTGSGIPDDRMMKLFDDPQKELAIAKRAVTAMGGSIQVRSNFGKGSRFEISVNLALRHGK